MLTKTDPMTNKISTIPAELARPSVGYQENFCTTRSKTRNARGKSW